jgi:hypothetical protein
MSTGDMVADLLTKPVTKAVLDRLKQKLYSGSVDIKSKPGENFMRMSIQYRHSYK